MAIKYISNGRKIFQMTIKYTNIFHSTYGPPKFTQIDIFGFKIYHLATMDFTEWLDYVTFGSSPGLPDFS
jgi:hypothetical protein